MRRWWWALLLLGACSRHARDDFRVLPMRARVKEDSTCRHASMTRLAECLRTSGPDACASREGEGLCDLDRDGLADDLEAALAREYAPVFAFNGGGFGGRAETDWPTNLKQFVSSAQLFYRPDGELSRLVDAAPSLEHLVDARVYARGREREVGDAKDGSDFWLCLRDADGESGVRIESVQAMEQLADGIDLVFLVHGGETLGAPDDLAITYELFFAYNQFAGFDNHEGDWEGIQVLVNRQSGKVDGAWFGRHRTLDDHRLVLRSEAAVRDVAAVEPGRGDNVRANGPQHALRFFDFAGLQRHVVAFVGTGSHAMYDYPGNTYLPRYLAKDTHDGDGPTLVTDRGQLLDHGAAHPLAIHFLNAGESDAPLAAWSAFRGQWGCTNRWLAKSWPGPFGNTRHARPALERTRLQVSSAASR